MAYGIETGQLESPADRYGQGSRFYKNTKRILKVMAYFIYFLLVLCTAVVSKGSFLLMTQSLGNIKQERQYASRWSMLITAAICIPYLFIFMQAISHSLFRNRKGPSVFDIIFVFFLEGIHSFGLCLLVFRVLPSCDVIRAVLLMNCMCFIPGLCKIVFSKNYTGSCRKVLIFIIDILAFVAQLTAFFVIMGTQYTAFIEKATYTTTPPSLNDAKSEDPFVFAESNRQQAYDTNAESATTEKPKWISSWETPFALLLTSVTWWENYVDRDIKICCFKIPLASYKRHLQSVRSKTNIGASLWKIALTITFSIILLPSKRFENAFVRMPNSFDSISTTVPTNLGGDSVVDFGSFDTQLENAEALMGHKINKRDILTTPSMPIAMNLDSILTVPNNAWNVPTTPNLFDFVATKEKTHDDYWKTINPFIPFIVHFFSSALCYYFAKSACKMCMQRVAFALPLTLATPLTIGIYIGICSSGLNRIDFIKDMMYWECSENFSHGNLKWQLIFGLGLWWLSEIWIALHAWSPENKRLAATELLFVLPQYDSVLIEQSLLLNRRRNEKEHLKRKLEEHFEELDIVDGMEGIDNDKQYDVIPKIYLCGTLWHETRIEMIQILKSIMRMDIDQSARKKAKDYFNVIDPDFYEIESHIFFDDAFEKNDKGQKTINSFVKELMGAIDKAASKVHDIEGMKMTPPIKTPTPYGGRLTWKLPGGNLLHVHLKDKKKVIQQKRWSMVMYMYYLLGYRLLGQCEDRLQALYRMVEEDPRKRKHKRHVAQGEEVHIYYKDVLGPKLLLEAENTYILSMDGDVDFGPDSVRMLVDRMKKNKRVGAACGRVHPIGSGPLIWFQRMEYALSYWLQKTTEHSLGCVLCAPGCFSMYRASSLMDDNVMRMFAQRPECADDHLLQNLGEDRWLSRLLIEQGYKIEYCAASDAYTHAPETITEYFNQRRRWIPSTLGHTICFLKNYRRTIRLNENVSFLCVLYHICFLASYVLTPATITIAIADAFNATTDIDMWGSFILACLPAFVFLIVCYQKCKEEIKIGFAAMLGTYYSILMMIVVVGTIVRVVDGSWKTTAVLFLIIMAAIFFLTAVCHPFELSCVNPCLLFFLCIPTNYILVIIYSLTNMNQCTWGTRDNHLYRSEKKRKMNLDENDIKELEKQLTDAKTNNELISKIEELLENGANNSNDELLLQILAALERIELKETIEKQFDNGVEVEKIIDQNFTKKMLNTAAQYGSVLAAYTSHKAENEEASSTYWLHQEEALKFSDLHELDDTEIVFWKKLIKKYLTVEKMDTSKKAKLEAGLKDMRDKGVFGFFMLNSLWIAFVFPVLLAQDRLKDMLYIPIPIPSLYYQPVMIEPLGVLHLCFFAFISLTQFLAMLCHRYNTFQHILASTKLRSNIHEGMRIEDIIDTVKMLQQIKPIDEEAEPMPDYSDEEIDDASESDEATPNDEKKTAKFTNQASDTDYSKHYTDINDQFLRRRIGKYGHDNPGFIDDTNISKSAKKSLNSRSKSEDRIIDMKEDDLNQVKIQAKRNRRSRRLQKKNSLDVQFRRRFSMLRDGNVVANSIYNSSEVGNSGVNGFISNVNDTSIANGAGRESVSGGTGMLGPRASYGNLSSKLLDKRFNKLLVNMPVIPTITNDSSKQFKSDLQPHSSSSAFQYKSHRRKSSVADEII